jgi:hypothetical protein
MEQKPTKKTKWQRAASIFALIPQAFDSSATNLGTADFADGTDEEVFFIRVNPRHPLARPPTPTIPFRPLGARPLAGLHLVPCAASSAVLSLRLVSWTTFLGEACFLTFVSSCSILYGSGETAFFVVSVSAWAVSKSANFCCHSASLSGLSHAW